MKNIDDNKHTNPVTITTYIHQLKNRTQSLHSSHQKKVMPNWSKWWVKKPHSAWNRVNLHLCNIFSLVCLFLTPACNLFLQVCYLFFKFAFFTSCLLFYLQFITFCNLLSVNCHILWPFFPRFMSFLLFLLNSLSNFVSFLASSWLFATFFHTFVSCLH